MYNSRLVAISFQVYIFLQYALFVCLCAFFEVSRYDHVLQSRSLHQPHQLYFTCHVFFYLIKK